MRSKVRMPSARVAVMAICALLAVLASTVSTVESARATGSWPVTVPYEQRPGQVGAIASGGAMVADCVDSGGDPAQLTEFSDYTADGVLFNSATSSSSEPKSFCGTKAAVGNDGRAYGYKQDSTYSTYTVVGYYNSVEEWSYPLANTCQGSPYPVSLIGMALGADSNLYVLQYDSWCNESAVIVFDTATHQVLRTLGLGMTVDYYSGGLAYLAAYRDGVVVKYGSKTFRYFSYAGIEDTTKTYDPSLSSNQSITDWRLNFEGDIFIVLDGTNYNRTGSCQISAVVESVIKRTPAGAITSYDLETQCMRLQDFGVTPSGGAVLTSKYDYTPDASPLVILKSNGDVQTASLPIPTGYEPTTTQVYYAQVGINGNVLFTRNLQNSSSYRLVTELELLDSNGQLVGRQISEQLYMPSSNLAYIATTQPALANGYVYALFCERYMPYDCGAKHLYKLKFVEAAFEYPRGLIAGVAVPPNPMLNYVALGDSFSSGEGVTPFITETDTAGPPENRCHRSEIAYAKLLDESLDPAISNIKLQTGGFVACSGAKTENITTTGQWNEPKQIDVFSADTNLVTVTIGGNDVGFADYVRACLDPTVGSCDSSSAAYSEIMSRINDELPGKLDGAYSAIATRMSQQGSAADVLIVGYPFVIREVAYGGTCTEIELTQLEQQAAEAVTIAINEKISEAMVRLGNPKFHFVDASLQESPFTGHDLCGGSSYFNNISSPLVFTAHPNSLGQAAYASLVKDYWLKTH